MVAVSIRRADYWLVEVQATRNACILGLSFQSAGRIIGWLKAFGLGMTMAAIQQFQSAGRIIGWLKSRAEGRLGTYA